jgi:hypothetical protein
VIQILLVLASLCALALARLEWGTSLDRMAVVFALDRSLRRAGRRGGGRWPEREGTEAMRGDDIAGLVVFGAEARPRSSLSACPSSAVPSSVARDGTDIGSA